MYFAVIGFRIQLTKFLQSKFRLVRRRFSNWARTFNPHEGGAAHDSKILRVSPWVILETHYLTCNHLQQLTPEGPDNTVHSQLEFTSCVSESNAFLRVRGMLSRPGSSIAASTLRETAEMATPMVRTLKETTKFVSLYEALL